MPMGKRNFLMRQNRAVTVVPVLLEPQRSGNEENLRPELEQNELGSPKVAAPGMSFRLEVIGLPKSIQVTTVERN
jgi:hypothetical protein